MKVKHLIGTILLLSSLLFGSCVNIEPEVSHQVCNEYGWVYVKPHSFGFGETKATRSFNWERGDQVCIYSLRDGVITYKDTVTISNANGNTCKIKALVDVDATQYFATFPMNAIKSEVGEVLDDDNLRVQYNGTYYIAL